MDQVQVPKRWGWKLSLALTHGSQEKAPAQPIANEPVQALHSPGSSQHTRDACFQEFRRPRGGGDSLNRHERHSLYDAGFWASVKAR